MLDEKQGWGDRNAGVLLCHDDGVEHGLQVIVGVLFQVFLREDGIHIGQGLHAVGARLVVNDSNVGLAVAVGEQVHSVYAPADGNLSAEARHFQLCVDVGFHVDEGERGELPVVGEQLAQIVDDDFTMDDLQSVQSVFQMGGSRQMGQVPAEGLVSGHLNEDRVPQELVDVRGEDGRGAP